MNPTAMIRSQHLVVDGLCYMPDPGSSEYLARARECGLSAIHFTVAKVEDRLEGALHCLGRWRQLLRQNTELALWVSRADDIEAARRAGKVGVILGWQNALPLEPDLAALETFHAAGLRIVQVTYQRQNAFGSGCGEPRDSGLSAAGRRLVTLCNELGVALDISHCGPRTTLEVIEASQKPVFITHSASAVISKNVRAKSDEAIKRIAEKGGVFGVLSYRSILCGDDDWTGSVGLEMLVRHVEHALDLVGEDHVSLGYDFTPSWTEAEYSSASTEYPEIYKGCPFDKKHLDGFGSIEELGNAITALERRGLSATTIGKILGGNFVRVFRASCG